MPHTRGAHSGARRRNNAASLSETKTLASNAAAMRRSKRNKVRASRRYTQLIGQRRDSAYCRHLSESTSTKSMTRRTSVSVRSTYWAIGPEYTNTCRTGRSRKLPCTQRIMPAARGGGGRGGRPPGGAGGRRGGARG